MAIVGLYDRQRDMKCFVLANMNLKSRVGSHGICCTPVCSLYMVTQRGEHSCLLLHRHTRTFVGTLHLCKLCQVTAPCERGWNCSAWEWIYDYQHVLSTAKPFPCASQHNCVHTIVIVGFQDGLLKLPWHMPIDRIECRWAVQGDRRYSFFHCVRDRSKRTDTGARSHGQVVEDRNLCCPRSVVRDSAAGLVEKHTFTRPAYAGPQSSALSAP